MRILFQSLILASTRNSTFHCLFSNAEIAFHTYKTFYSESAGGEDTPPPLLLMPYDAGFVRLAELERFYYSHGESYVGFDPRQVADYFRDAMHYMLGVVVAHMRAMKITEMEMMALVGMLICEALGSRRARATAIKQYLLASLHGYYRALGYREAAITVRVAELMLLIPKLEVGWGIVGLVLVLALNSFVQKSLTMCKERFYITELFNMMQLE